MTKQISIPQITFKNISNHLESLYIKAWDTARTTSQLDYLYSSLKRQEKTLYKRFNSFKKNFSPDATTIKADEEEESLSNSYDIVYAILEENAFAITNDYWKLPEVAREFSLVEKEMKKAHTLLNTFRKKYQL